MYLVSQAKKQRFLAQENRAGFPLAEAILPCPPRSANQRRSLYLQLVRRSSRAIRLTTLDITNLNHTMGRVGIEPTT